MPTIRNVSTIKSTLLAPATTSHFDVEIGFPSGSLGAKLRGILGGTTLQQDRLNLMCSEAVLPGSSLATTEVNNDYTGVTERHAYRRIYDETIDLSFYIDAANYLPVQFFETWISEILNEDQEEAISPNYTYRAKYPDDYMNEQGLKIIKFEKDLNSQLQYTFIRSYPRSITSMPVTYDGSSLLKCSVQMSYIRYVMRAITNTSRKTVIGDPFQQAAFNSNGLSNLAATIADNAIDRITGNDFLGDVAGGLARRAVGNLF
tara:strand:- start:424 stop:1203 length:780 start_codon:yes stop_codon:yes gene_type:complete